MRYFVSVLFLVMLAIGFAQGGDEAIYTINCVACHQASGEGLAGAFPNLKGNVSEIVGLEGGRDYLIRAVLFGMKGEIKVVDNVFNGTMPAWVSLSDEDIAGVLNYVVKAWEQELPEVFEEFTAEEVAAARGEELSFDDVLALRPDRICLLGVCVKEGAKKWTPPSRQNP